MNETPQQPSEPVSNPGYLNFTPEMIEILLKAPTNDSGNADRIVALHGENWIFVRGVGDLHWTGTHWRKASQEDCLQLAISTMRALAYVAETAADRNRGHELTKLAERSSHLQSLRSALEIARSHPRLQADARLLDADLDHLNILDGRVKLRTGELEPHCRSAYDTKVAPVHYPDGEGHWAFTKFMDLLEQNGALETLQEIAGAALSGRVEKRFFSLVGPSGTGKSTFIDVLVELLGSYAQTIEPDTLKNATAGAGRARPDLAKLRGARLVVTAEFAGNISMSLIKRFTGLDVINARDLYSSELSFRPTFTVLTHGNSRPRFDSSDTGMHARACEVPFNALPTAPSVNVREALREPKALSAMLGFAIQGAMRWYRNNLRTTLTAAVQEQTAELLRENSPYDDWASERIIFSTDGWTPSADLFEDLRGWCHAHGFNGNITLRGMVMWLTSKDGVRSGDAQRRNKRRGVAGVQLVRDTA